MSQQEAATVTPAQSIVADFPPVSVTVRERFTNTGGESEERKFAEYSHFIE